MKLKHLNSLHIINEEENTKPRVSVHMAHHCKADKGDRKHTKSKYFCTTFFHP